MPKAITSLVGFIRKLASLNSSTPGGQFLFRGHSDADYQIQPSVYRSANLEQSEHLMIRQLLAQQPREFLEDAGIFDQLVRAQHYGLPTRLLDVTQNPLVALYFAVASNPKKRASVVVFKPDIGKQRFYDSDRVSCLSTLALLTKSEKDDLRKSGQASLNGASSKLISGAPLQKFNESSEAQKLIQLVRHEKPDFRPIIQPYDLARPVAVIPRKLHSRIIAQSGAFIIFGLGKKLTSSDVNWIETEEIHVAADEKSSIMRDLANVGISESSLFPEIEKASIAIKNRYK